MTALRTIRWSVTMQERQGFTLIELLIVVVIIGLLAALAIPKFANSKGKAVVTQMRSDLRNLATAQEAYWVQNRTYYKGKVPDAAFQYNTSAGVIVTIVDGTPAGWSAEAKAPGLSPQYCAIFYGDALPVPPATIDAAVACN
jgi:type IV pilus assembly protein PilA